MKPVALGSLRTAEDFLRYVAATLFGLVLLSLIAGIPIALVVTSTYGLGEGIRTRAETSLSGPFFTVSIAKVLFNPLKGFVLKGLSINDRAPSARLIASATQLSISLNMESLLHRRPRLQGIILRDARMDIPLGSGEEPRLRLEGCNGRINCDAEQFRVEELTFMVAGIDVHITGSFLNPRLFDPKPVSPTGPGSIAKTIDSIQKELEEIKWSEAHPKLTLVAGGNLADSETLRVDQGLFLARLGNWKGVGVRQFELGFHYKERKLSVEKFSFDDGMGVLRAEATADFASNVASLEFSGACNAAPLPALLLGKDRSRDWTCADPVRMNGSFSAAWKGGVTSFDGHALLDAGRFNYRGVQFNTLSGGVALQDKKVLLRNLHVAGDMGVIDADLLLSPGDNRVRFQTSLYPAKLAPAVTGKASEALASMDFKDPLVVSFDGHGTAADPLVLKGTGSIELGRAAMRGAWIESLRSKVQVEDGAASFRDIIVKMDGDTGKGEFVYDFKNWEGRIPSIHTKIDPVKVMTWIDPRIADALKNYRFVRPPELQLAGKVGLKNPEKNDLRIALNAHEGLGYTLIGKDLQFGATSGSVVLTGQKLAINLPESHLMGGDVAFKADVSVAPGDSRYSASVHLEDIDFHSLTKLYFDYGDSTGKLSGDYSFQAVGGDDRAMAGKGNILIKNGNVLAMPILGPLSVLLNEVVPGLGYQSARRATASFTVGNGVITTRDLLIEGIGFNMIGNGDIYYLDDRMTMNIRLNAQGLPGLVLFPVSKIFEYVSDGSAKHPQWRPKILPKRSQKEQELPQPPPVTAIPSIHRAWRETRNLA